MDKEAGFINPNMGCFYLWFINCTSEPINDKEICNPP